MTAKASLAQAALRDRREAGLLSLPSVARMAEVLAEQCRETSWVRLAVSTLDRFRAACVGEPQQLEVLLALARDEPETAMSSLARFAACVSRYTASQVEALAFGTKVWLALEGVAGPWRPLRNDLQSAGPFGTRVGGDLKLVLQAMIGSGLALQELVAVRLADVGVLTANGDVAPDVLASPLAIRYTPLEAPETRRLTFLPFHAQPEFAASLARRAAAGRQRKRRPGGPVDPPTSASPPRKAHRGGQRRQRGHLPRHRRLLPWLGDARGALRHQSRGHRMKAAMLHAYHEHLVVEDVPDPELTSPNDVVVRIGAAGLCRTDLHIYEGQFAEAQKQAGLTLPYAPGHENAGWVEAIGTAVTNVAPGDTVIVHPLMTCGLCRA